MVHMKYLSYITKREVWWWKENNEKQEPNEPKWNSSKDVKGLLFVPRSHKCLSVAFWTVSIFHSFFSCSFPFQCSFLIFPFSFSSLSEHSFSFSLSFPLKCPLLPFPFFLTSFLFLFCLLQCPFFPSRPTPPSLLCSETRRSADGSSAGGSAEWSGVWDEVSDRDGFYPSPTGRSQSPGEQQPGLQSVRLQTASGRQDRGGLQHTSECFIIMQHCTLKRLPMCSTSQW